MLRQALTADARRPKHERRTARALHTQIKTEGYTGGYLFTNKRANRIKVLVHDGIGIWLAARRLHQGKFVWPATSNEQWQLESDQLQALVLGLPWRRMGDAGVITVV